MGETVRRIDAIPKVAGEFAYASDLYAADMLWGHTVRSPHAHALIRAIDTSKAVGMPGVHAVLTHEDVPGEKRYGLEFADQPVLAFDRVRYFGEAVVVVAAEHPEQARRAAEQVHVEYEELEPVSDPERAPDSDPIHPERWTEGHGYRDDPRPNVVRSITIRHGDPETEAEVTVEGTYELGIQDQAFLGPESGLAVPDGEGGVDIYVATQWLHVDRDQIAPCLGLTPNRVRIHLAGVGGAFGGREDLSMQIHGAMLALHTNRPVKFVYTREESFVGHVHRHPARIWMEHGANRDGTLVSVRARILLDGGAYASSSTAVVSNAACFACGPYAVPNALIEATCVYTNNPPCGAMRGFGSVQVCFAHEAQMDKLADALGLGHVDLRLRNALAPGDVLPTGQTVAGSLPVAEVIRRCADIPAPGSRGAAARPHPPPGRRRQHDARGRCAPRRRLRGRLQEHLLLGGLRRLLRRPRPAVRGRRRRARRRGALGGGRGRPGRGQRDGTGGPHRARRRERRRRAPHDAHRRVVRLVLRVAPDLDDRGRRPARLRRRQARARPAAAARSRPARRSRSSASTATRARTRSIPRRARSSAATARTWRLPARPCG